MKSLIEIIKEAVAGSTPVVTEALAPRHCEWITKNDAAEHFIHDLSIDGEEVDVVDEYRDSEEYEYLDEQCKNCQIVKNDVSSAVSLLKVLDAICLFTENNGVDFKSPFVGSILGFLKNEYKEVLEEPVDVIGEMRSIRTRELKEIPSTLGDTIESIIWYWEHLYHIKITKYMK